jgi:hypothetical protein
MYHLLSTSSIINSWTQVKNREYIKPHTALVETNVRPRKLEIRNLRDYSYASLQFQNFTSAHDSCSGKEGQQQVILLPFLYRFC